MIFKTKLSKTIIASLEVQNESGSSLKKILALFFFFFFNEKGTNH